MRRRRRRADPAEVVVCSHRAKSEEVVTIVRGRADVPGGGGQRDRGKDVLPRRKSRKSGRIRRIEHVRKPLDPPKARSHRGINAVLDILDPRPTLRPIGRVDDRDKGHLLGIDRAPPIRRNRKCVGRRILTEGIETPCLQPLSGMTHKRRPGHSTRTPVLPLQGFHLTRPPRAGIHAIHGTNPKAVALGGGENPTRPQLAQAKEAGGPAFYRERPVTAVTIERLSGLTEGAISPWHGRYQT